MGEFNTNLNELEKLTKTKIFFRGNSITIKGIHDDINKASTAIKFLINKYLKTNVVEKQVISDIALTGIHYWKRGSDFVASAKQLIADDNRSLNEFYISTTYNYLIEKGLKVGHHMLDDSGISFIGTPEDLDIYLGRRSLGY